MWAGAFLNDTTSANMTKTKLNLRYDHQNKIYIWHFPSKCIFTKLHFTCGVNQHPTVVPSSTLHLDRLMYRGLQVQFLITDSNSWAEVTFKNKNNTHITVVWWIKIENDLEKKQEFWHPNTPLHSSPPP